MKRAALKGGSSLRGLTCPVRKKINIFYIAPLAPVLKDGGSA